MRDIESIPFFSFEDWQEQSELSESGARRSLDAMIAMSEVYPISNGLYTFIDPEKRPGYREILANVLDAESYVTGTSVLADFGVCAHEERTYSVTTGSAKRVKCAVGEFDYFRTNSIDPDDVEEVFVGKYRVRIAKPERAFLDCLIFQGSRMVQLNLQRLSEITDYEAILRRVGTVRKIPSKLF